VTGGLRTTDAPGAWLRACAVAVAAAALLAVVSGAAGLGTAHRVVAALAAPPLAALVVAALLSHRNLIAPVAATGALLVAAAVAPPGPAHLGLAAPALAAASALAVATFRGGHVRAGSWRDYVTLTKPRIMTLLLLTGLCGAAVGAEGRPSAALLATVLVGLGLACGGASALNHVLDRDIDRLMGPRTATRPVASGRITPPRALEFGLALSAASFTVLASGANLLTAVLALVGNLFYVIVYTGYLKRRGPQNIVLGGAAGAVPPLVGYAAATGSIAVPAIWLFVLVCLWTPPHFWALALLLKEHYRNADVPMLPVVAGDAATLRRIVGYTVILVAASVVPFATGVFGPLYLAAALILGGIFLALALRLSRAPSRRGAATVFHYSLLYLALLFVAAAISPLV
jgi:protoheme IX farnesyltransferase